jgi:hypothetical protein
MKQYLSRLSSLNNYAKALEHKAKALLRQTTAQQTDAPWRPPFFSRPRHDHP